MPEPEGFDARVAAAVGPDGRLPAPELSAPAWARFPFEGNDVRVKALHAATVPEPERAGDGASPCPLCRKDQPPVWRHDRWRLDTVESGLPLVLVLQPVEHRDLHDLPDDLAAEFGVLLTHLVRHVEALRHVARCHVQRMGDGVAHAHVFLVSRPLGRQQWRGPFLATWGDLLPLTPAAEVAADARTVATALAASFGGSVVD